MLLYIVIVMLILYEISYNYYSLTNFFSLKIYQMLFKRSNVKIKLVDQMLFIY